MTRRKHFFEGISYELTPLERIRFTDLTARQLRHNADLAGDHLIDLAEWTRDGLLALATCYPVLISRSPRSSGMYHVIANRYVLYTWLMQALRTSLRAIASPVALLDAVERTSLALDGAALPPAIYTAISDKSGGFEDRARLIELEGELLQQLSNFRAHAAVVVARLDLFAEWSLGTSAVQRLFALDDTAKPIAVTPAWVEDNLARLAALAVVALLRT